MPTLWTALDLCAPPRNDSNNCQKPDDVLECMSASSQGENDTVSTHGISKQIILAVMFTLQILGTMKAQLLVCILCLAFSPRRSIASTAAPWQTSSGTRTLHELKTYEELPPTVFSPTGRLHSVEKIAKDVSAPFDPFSNLVVALTCKDGLVVLSTLATSPPLNASTTSTPLFLVSETPAGGVLSRLGPDLAAAIAGNAADGQVMRNKVARLVTSLSESAGDTPVSPAILARRLADNLQLLTQKTGSKEGRILSVSSDIHRLLRILVCWSCLSLLQMYIEFSGDNR